MKEKSLNRREFTRSMVYGAGALPLLDSSPRLFAASLWPHRTKHAKPGSLSVQVGQTVEITRSRDRCWFPSLHQFANKDLIATMSMHADTTHPDEGFRVAYCISHDGGATWSQRYGADTVPGVWSDVPGGPVWGLTAHIVGQESDQDFYFSRAQLSGPGANVASAEIKVDLRKDVRLHMSEPTQGVMFTGSILPSHGSSLVTCVYSRTKQSPKYYHLACARSDDHGQTWREGAIIASVPNVDQPPQGMGKDGPCEAGLVRLRDGRLFVIYRTGSDGCLGTAWSSDEGRTWTPLSLIPFKGVEPRVRLLSNGILACSTGRPGPVTMMFSLDGTGKTWSNETPIFSDMSTRYTEFLELAPGKLFLVYDSVPYGWKMIPATDEKAQNMIYGTYLDIELRS
jgi:hypothetical protein